MNKALKTILESLETNNLLSCNFSSPRNKKERPRNIIISKIKESSDFKVEFRLEKHNDIKTISSDELKELVTNEALNSFKQILIKSDNEDIQILMNKKLESKIIRTQSSTKKANHNRKKNYLIPDDQECDFLIEIGVMSPNGKVKPNYYKKFKQINRFLELVDDLFKDSTQDSFHIVDFGCGKSYLTFALYYYFTTIKKSQAQITGIDLKQEVIDHCNKVAEKLSYQDLKFVHGFIHDFSVDRPIDFVVTLHACDTATDDAILFSVKNHAEKMMFVPCCQHELNKQIQNNHSNILLKHGIFKDRMTALVTDTMRTQLLEAIGYKVQTMEFIDLEHTAKNILLRCQKSNKTQAQKDEALEFYSNFKKEWQITPYLERELRNSALL